MNLNDIKPSKTIETLLDISIIEKTHYTDTATEWLQAGAVLLAVGNTGPDEKGKVLPTFAIGWPRSKGNPPQTMLDA